MVPGPTHSAGRRKGFTLIELLTVVAIIGLLMGILLPSLARARNQAKRLKVRATLSAIETGLEMFHGDFGEYPASRRGIDPIVDLGHGGTRAMEGAHWLARAMVGHDFRGPDAGSRSLSRTTDVSKAELENAGRCGPYLESATIVLDTDTRFANVEIGPGRRSAHPILIDDCYASPILYYRANSRAKGPFCVFGDGINDRPDQPSEPGTYALVDNQGITGRWDDGSESGLSGWDFAQTGIRPHPLAAFGSIDPNSVDVPPAFYSKGKTFTGFLYDANALKVADVVKPHNPETFLLIDAGKDGIYGTPDDVTNF